MAANISNETSSVHPFEGILSDKKDSIACDCCEVMKAELIDVKLELNSFKEIVKVLQEELR
jgi:hypothetical protein